MIIVLHCAEVTRVCCEKGMITEILVLVENGVLHKKSLHCDIFCILQKSKIPDSNKTWKIDSDFIWCTEHFFSTHLVALPVYLNTTAACHSNVAFSPARLR